MKLRFLWWLFFSFWINNFNFNILTVFVWTLFWSLSEVIRNIVHKQIQRIFGSIKVHGVWRIQYKGVLYRLYKDNGLVMYKHVKGLKWAGHVVRIVDFKLSP